MANSKITWTDKESLVTDPTIAEKNKVTDSNMNEIKSVVNENADQVIVSDTEPTSADNELWVDTSSNATYINQEVNIGATNPSNIRTWFKQGKNLINKNVWNAGYYTNTGSYNTSVNNATFSIINVLPNTTYTFSVNGNTTWVAITEFNNSAFVKRNVSTTYPVSQLTFTTDSTTNIIYVSLNHSDTEMTQAKIDEREPQLELGTTKTTYEEYVKPEIITNDKLFFATPQPIPNSAFTNFLTGTMDTNHSFTIGNAVFINIRITGATKPASGWRNLLNIADAYRPSKEAHPIIQVPYTKDLNINSVIYNNGDIGINDQSDSWGSNIINIFATYYK